MVAYGPLMHSATIKRILGANPRAFIECTLDGWRQDWTLAIPNTTVVVEVDRKRFAPEHFLELNLRRARGATVQGVLFVVSQAQLVILDRDRAAYERIDITGQLRGVEMVGGNAFVYVGRHELTRRPGRSPRKYAVRSSAVADIESALKERSEEFRKTYTPNWAPPKRLVARELGPAPRAELQDVIDAELAHLRHHRHPERDLDVVRRSLVGLALSGGGIRSATTNLGILQALASMRLLPMIDYVSTVSGGGYIGSCLSSLLSWNRTAPTTSPDPRAPFTFGKDQRPAFSTEPSSFPFRSNRAACSSDVPVGGERGPHPERIHPRAGNDLVAHLRTHGNFLIAHRGLFRRDALRGIGALTVGMVYNASAFLLSLFAASAIYLAVALALAPGMPKLLSWPTAATIGADTTRPALLPDTTRPPLVAADSTVVRTRQEACVAGVPGCVTETEVPMHPPAIGDALLRNVRTVGVAFVGAWRQWGDSGGRWFDRMRDVPAPLRPILFALALGVSCAIVVLIGIHNRLDAYLTGRIAERQLAPGDSAEEVFERGVLKRATATLVLAIFIAIFGGRALWADLVGSGVAQIVWLFVPFAVLTGAVLVAFFAITVVLPGKSQWTRRLRSLSSAFYAIASWGFYIMLAFAIAPLAIYAMRDHPIGAGVGAIGSLIVTRFLAGRGPGSGKRFSLSPGAMRMVLGLFVLLLIVLGTLFFAALVAKHSETWIGPLLAGGVAFLILAILGRLADHNKLGPQFFYRDRLAETYLFSELPDEHGKLRVFRDAMEMPLDVLHGQPAADDPTWRNTTPYHLISAAINLAGSRDLTRKDRKSGYWLFSKLYCGSTHTGFRPTFGYRGGKTKVVTAVSISGAAASSAIGRDTFFAQAFATVLFNIRLGSWVENPANDRSLRGTEGGIFWPSYLFREIGMNTTESARLVNLSDGGHTGDNIGIYPLLQRRCKVIIACDAERDPRLSFGSFTEALRHAYVDLGIDVDIDLTMVRADPTTGLSRSHCAVGRIHYPDRPDQASFLIYLKNSLLGTEPETVLNYKVTCPDFPHETTADQFFDDAQFESYRALGVHIAEHAFAQWVAAEEFDTAQKHHTPEVTANA